MRTEVDPRLLIFLPHYKALFLRGNPKLEGTVTDDLAKEAMLLALRESGAVREVRTAHDILRLEPTAEFLKSSGQK
jgi:hypothetical protein